jgi:pimeloyl-ACP methyl ester carboxylesterase
LVILPGFTQDALSCEAFISGLGSSNYTRKKQVLIIENPGHGENLSQNLHDPADGSRFPTPDSSIEYIRELVEKIGLRKFDLMGYSMGGAGAFNFLATAGCGKMVRRCMLLTPGFYQCLTPEFRDIIETNPRQAHGWETIAEMDHFFNGVDSTAGFHAKHMPPAFILQGFVYQRKSTLPLPDYFSKFADASLPLIRTLLTDKAEAVRNAVEANQIDVLLIIPDRDRCVDPAKLREVRAMIGPRCTELVLEDYGHVGGPANKGQDHVLPFAAGQVGKRFFSEGPPRSSKL